MEKQLTGSHALLQALVDHGVTTMFGYPGGANMPVYDAMKDFPTLEHVLVRHEQAAVFAAQGRARTTGKVGVAFATSGPGCSNALTGLLDAYMDSIPIVLITGQVARPMIGRDAFQELDAVGASMSMTKHNYLCHDVQELPEIVHEAIHIATHGRPGPVLIDIPKDVAAGMYTSSTHSDGKNMTISLTTQKKHLHEPIMDEVLEQFYGMLYSAQKPVLLVGQGVKHAGAEKQINQFIEKTQIPTVTTLLAKGIISPEQATYLGGVGMHGFYDANLATAHTDLIINIGSRFDDRIVGTYASFAQHAQVIHVDIDKAELNKCVETDLGIHADAKVFLDALLAYADVHELQIAGRKERIAGWGKEHPFEKETEHFTMKSVYSIYNQNISGKWDDYIVTTDVGQHQMWARQVVKVASSRHRLTSGGAGSMGFGLPAAMGASFAYPDKTSMLFVGDGGFQMSFNELQTISEHQCNVKIVILNNGFLGMVRQWQQLFFDKNYASTNISSPNFQQLAQAFSMPGHRVVNQTELEQVFAEELSREGPAIIECIVEPEANVFPMVPSGKSLGETIVKV